MIDFQKLERAVAAKRQAIVPMTEAFNGELEFAFMRSNGNFNVQWQGTPRKRGLRWSFRKARLRAQLDWIPTPRYVRYSIASRLLRTWLAADPKTL